MVVSGDTNCNTPARQLFPFSKNRPDNARGDGHGEIVGVLLANGKFFAFVGRAGDLVLKLPEAQATALVEAGKASAVHAGRNATREWVSVPMPSGRRADRWRELLADAYRNAVQK